MISLQHIQCQLKKLTKFIKPLLPLINSHLVQFLTDDQWNTLLNKTLRTDLMNLKPQELSLLPTATLLPQYIDAAETTDGCESLHAFLNSVRDHQLESLGILAPKEQLTHSLAPNEKFIDNYKVRMSPKKVHEVSNMIEIVASLCKDSEINWIVDIGSGLGYLSSSLAVHYGFSTLAVDSSSSNTAHALKRSNSDEILWQKSQRLPSDERSNTENGLKPRGKKAGLSKYRQKKETDSVSVEIQNSKLIGVTKFVKDDEDLLALISDCQPKVEIHRSDQLAVVGLHTCGSLAPTSIRLFAANSSVKLLCNVSCCYHLLNEEFSSDDPYIKKCRHEFAEKRHDGRYDNLELDPFHQFLTKEAAAGFPLSLYLRKESFALGRNARMLATNAVHRLSLSNTNERNKTLFWRAIFDILVLELCGRWPLNMQVGKNLGNKTSDFHGYCRKALENIGITTPITDDEITSYYCKYKHKEDEMNRFFLLKSSLGPLIEGIILLDRLAFLHEQGFTNSHIVQLFDKVTSPRCMAIIAVK